MEQKRRDECLENNYFSDLDYWNQKLDKEVTITAFPHDKTKRGGGISKERISRLLPLEVTDKFYEMTNQSNLGVYMILVSGVMYLLSRYNGVKDIVVGTPILEQKENDTSLKDFILLRSKLTPEMTFREWISDIKETVTEAFRHQEVPINIIAEQVGLVFSEDKKPLLETLVLFDPIQSKSNIDAVFSDMVFSFELLQGKISLVLEYEKEIFHKETLEHLIDSLFVYYESIIRDTGMKLEDINLLSEQSKNIILNDYNSPRVEQVNGNLTIQQLFEKQVSAQPNQIALVFEDQQLTYQELNDQADRLASYLVEAHCLRNDEAVAIFMNRSPSVYIAILGILKAGGTFIPIDPIIPIERVKSIFEEVRVRVALTLTTHVKDMNILQRDCEPFRTYICLDKEEVYAFSTEINLKAESNAQLAYIIFTSGSTGKPKGVEIKQKSVVQFLHAIDQVIEPASPQVVLNAASISFDLFISESLYSLFKGIKVVIANHLEHMDSVELSRLIEEHKIDLMMITPSRLQLLINHAAGQKALSNVKMILIGGQSMTRDFLNDIQALTKATIVNVYGPTETTCLATTSLLSEGKEINIGRPLENYSCYILDERNRLQLIGAIGELVISGEGLARGYINNLKLTQEKFIVDPFHNNQRLYRTGDLARWLPNGEIQYLGRMDNQVKIRGYRIETSDIESNILSHPDIREAVVLVNKDKDGNESLSAYLVSDKEWLFSDLYEYLKMKLPEYMVPAHLVQVPKLPLTINGKVDSKALEKLNHLKLSSSFYRAPSNDIQRVLVEVWEQLLRLESIGIDDNFFQIGGTSLSGVKMVALLSDRYTISINDIFSYPTIAELSVHVIEQEGYFVHMIETMKKTAVNKELSIVNGEQNMNLLKSYREKTLEYHKLDLTEQKKYENIFLTGGTGFLGNHILFGLLKKTDAHINVLVRGESEEAGKKYLSDRLHYYFDEMISETDWERISIVSGDLTKDNLGLSIERYDHLAKHVDCIIHAASLTRHYGTAEEFKKINVEGTQKILEIANKYELKDVHYISSMSIGTGSDIKIFDEFVEELGQFDDNINNHFLSTKAEAERLIRREQDQGLNCTIYRLNSLNNNTRTRKFMVRKESNAFYSFVLGLNQFGFYPDLHDPILDLTGVDQAAEAILTLFDRPALHNQNHHIFNPRRISWGQFGHEIQSITNKVEIIPFEEFICTLSERFKDPSTRIDVINIVLNLFLLRNTEWLGYQRLCEKTEYLLNCLGYVWENIEKQQIECYI